MAFNLAGAAFKGVNGVNGDLVNAFQPTPAVAARSQFPKAVVPRNDSNVPTINMFVDGVDEDMEYAASIIDVCPERTTYAIQCTSGPSYLTAGVCGSDGVVLTVTGGPQYYRVSEVTAAKTFGSDVSATVEETCSLASTTKAVCSGALGGTVNGQSTTISLPASTRTGSEVYYYNVAITGGAEKTASPKPTCEPTKSSGGGGGSSSSNNNNGGTSGASTKGVAIWALLGVAGVVSML
ncbi:hypothetical protein QBC47DRAFT_418385 [Echria macrotheca]|uniref:Uncharacterized protein n=1 Tax=Echria macrotheca TaxID=438768 RepID=A0AAJ0B4L0_9PEZI|nr:hypothetical protein QBC47DRAFT_418385 [Echria macrotheca]